MLSLFEVSTRNSVVIPIETAAMNSSEELMVHAAMAEDRMLINRLLRESPEASMGIESKHVFLMILGASLAGQRKIIDEVQRYSGDMELISSFMSKQITPDVLQKIVIPYHAIAPVIDHVLEAAIPEVIKRQDIEITKYLMLKYKEKTGIPFSDSCILEGGEEIINNGLEELGFHTMRVHAITSGNVKAYEYIRSLREPSTGCVIGEMFLALTIESPCVAEMKEHKTIQLVRKLIND